MNLMKVSVPALAALAIFAAPHAATAAKLTTVYSFGASGDGAGPSALIAYNGALYGATTSGGAGGSGTLFKLDPRTGVETPLYGFTGAADGAAPYGSLLAYKHVFYGTTYGGGANGSGFGGPGTVFKFDPATGLETVLHSFAGPDGSHPYSGLVAIGAYLYGTTFSGGAAGNGAIFRISLKTSKLTVLHSFNQTDGVLPRAAMILNAGILYGTTVGGGLGNGVVFTYNPATRAFAVLHEFAVAEGSDIQAGLTVYNGALYGAAYGGGAGGANGSGDVFKMDLATGAVTVLHSFSGTPPDGGGPIGGVTSRAGLLYGTENTGGTASYGSVYKVNPTTGAESLYYSFANGADGSTPWTTLVLVGKTLYGTTFTGGLNGGGTVFKIR